MKQLLRKELKLAASPVTYFFLAFSLITLLPGYPILCGSFFVALGIFQSFQNAREANDIVYSALLPVAKGDTVKSKYLFVLCIELTSFTMMAVLTLLRMMIWADASIYRTNVLMNANLFFLAMVLVNFALFNKIFIGGFFKTAYKFGANFIVFIVVAFLVIGLGETLHHIPLFASLNAFGFEAIGLQLTLFALGIVFFVGITYFSYRRACADFELVDL